MRPIAVFSLLLVLVACADDSEVKRLANARALLEKKDVNAAVVELKAALGDHPQSAALRLMLGRTLLQHGDPQAALQELGKAQQAGSPEAEVAPDLAKALLASGEPQKLIGQFQGVNLAEPVPQAALKVALAEAFLAQGDTAAARATLSSLLQAQPEQPDARVLLARLDAAAGEQDAALRALDRVLARDAKHAGAALAKGEVLMQSPQTLAAAQEQLQRLVAAQPDLVAGHVALVEALLRQQKTAEARSAFETLRKLAPQHRSTLALQARLAFDAKDYAGSLEICQRLLVGAPNHAGVLLLAGASQLQLQRHAQAADLLGKALKSAPGLLAARQLLAQTHLRDAQPEKALETLQASSDTGPRDATSLTLIGQARLQLGDSAGAQAAFAQAARLSPQDPAVRTSLALADISRGAGQPALAELERIARGDTGTLADQALVTARLRARDFKGALLAVDALQKKLPEQAMPWSLRGRVQLAQGDRAAAVASFEQALKRQPSHLPSVVALSNLDAAAGRPEPARQRLQALIKAEPKNVSARLALASLEGRLGAAEAVVTGLLREAVRADPAAPGAHRALVEHLQATGDAKAALNAARDAAAALPQDAQLQELLGTAQLAAGDSQQAISTFKRLMALQPGKAGHAVHLADAYLAAGDKAAAQAALKQAQAIDPDNAMALRGLALMAVMYQRLQEGLDMARAQQKRQPKDAAGFVLEGELLSRAGRWPEAAAAFSAALQRNRSSAMAINLHRTLTLAGKSAEATRLATEWQKANPEDAAFAFHLGDAASAAREWAAAEAQYRTVLKLQPRHAAAANNIAYALVMQNKPGAVAMAEQANQWLSDRAPFLDTLALALEADNQLAKALVAQKRAVALQPRDPTLRLRLAQLLLKSGEKSEARKELQALSELGERFARQAQVAQLLKGL